MLSNSETIYILISGKQLPSNPQKQQIKHPNLTNGIVNHDSNGLTLQIKLTP